MKPEAWTNRTMVLAGALVCVVAVASILWVLGQKVGERPEQGAPSGRLAAVHGVPADALDWSDSGLPLSKALKESGLSPALPQAEAAGHIVKVALDETGGDGTGRLGLLVLYDSGVKLKIAPGNQDVPGQFIRGRNASRFRDGREGAFEMATIAGRKTLVLPPGIQTSETGDYAVPARVSWDSGNLAYTLESSSPTASIDALLRLAAGIPDTPAP